jgi:hypothetical protein
MNLVAYFVGVNSDGDPNPKAIKKITYGFTIHWDMQDYDHTSLTTTYPTITDAKGERFYN